MADTLAHVLADVLADVLVPQQTAEATVRDVVCVVDHLYRDPRVADDVCRGRFTNNGVTLTLGSIPDWVGGGLADDDEWRIEWVKGYWGLDLAAAFTDTSDVKYLDAWQDLVESFCAQVPVGQDSSEVSARRIQNWLYGWQRLRAACDVPDFRPGLADRLRTRIIDDVAHLLEHLTAERNHRTLELYAVFVASLALPELAERLERPDLVAETVMLLTDNLLTDMSPDGVHRECSTDYHNIVLRSFVGVLANARRFSIAVPPDLVDRVSSACTFSMAIQRPDGHTPSFSDGDVGEYREMLAQAAELLERDDLAWVASLGTRGSPPRTLDATFPIGGYCTQRSGWGAGPRRFDDERWLMLDCGPLGDGGHGHYDQLSVEIAAGRRSLVVDPGRYTYADSPADSSAGEAWRRWFKGTAAHNTVTVDGLDQTPYRRGKPKGPMSTARLVSRRSEPHLDLLVAEVRSPQYSAMHTRRVAFVGREYWVIHDRLRDPELIRREYCLRWHLNSDANERTALHRTEAAWRVDAPGFRVVVVAPSGEVAIEDGWVSPTYGVKHPAPVVTARVRGHAADFVSLIVPGDATAELSCSVIFSDGGFTAQVARSHKFARSHERTVDQLAWHASASWTRRNR